MTTPISIVVPVGPQKEYMKYLDECAESILSQMTSLDELLFINDMNPYLDSWWREGYDTGRFSSYSGVTGIVHNDWLLGCADSWNKGVALADNDLVLLMGSDDKLLPGCLDALRESYDENKGKAAWYNLTIVDDRGEIHTVFNNAAAITKSLWRETGGFPPQAFAAPDALMISVLMVHKSSSLIQVAEGTPLYYVRTHAAQDTPRMAGRYSHEVILIRHKSTEDFKENPGWAADV